MILRLSLVMLCALCECMARMHPSYQNFDHDMSSLLIGGLLKGGVNIPYNHLKAMDETYTTGEIPAIVKTLMAMKRDADKKAEKQENLNKIQIMIREQTENNNEITKLNNEISTKEGNLTRITDQKGRASVENDRKKLLETKITPLSTSVNYLSKKLSYPTDNYQPGMPAYENDIDVLVARNHELVSLKATFYQQRVPASEINVHGVSDTLIDYIETELLFNPGSWQVPNGGLWATDNPARTQLMRRLLKRFCHAGAVQIQGQTLAHDQVDMRINAMSSADLFQTLSIIVNRWNRDIAPQIRQLFAGA